MRLEVLLLGLWCWGWSAAAASDGNWTHTNYTVTTSDGIHLQTVVYRATMWPPKATCAIMLKITPYDASKGSSIITQMEQEWWSAVKTGELVACLILQDLRGTGQSTGEFAGFQTTPKDAEETFKWAKEKPWCNGVVLSIGASAMGFSAYNNGNAHVDPPIRGQSIALSSNDLYQTVFPNNIYASGATNAMLQGWANAKYIKTFQSHEDPSTWWNNGSFFNFSHVTWSTSMLSAWYDLFLLTAIPAYDDYKTKSDPKVRDLHYFGIGAYGHCLAGGAIPWTPAQAWGAAAGTSVATQTLFELVQNTTDEQSYSAALSKFRSKMQTYKLPHILWFVMGPLLPGSLGSYTTGADEFPPTTDQLFYLQPDANITTSPPTTGGSVTYTSHPLFPVPTYGGANMLWKFSIHGISWVPCGPQDQLHLGTRHDIVSWTSQPLTEATALMGSARMILYVSSDSPDTDFFVKLEDVYPNTTRMLVQDGGVRMRWRTHGKIPDPLMKPGQVYKVEVELLPACWIFNVGHSIGIDISSTNSPRFSVNPGTGNPVIEGAKGRRAQENTVHFTADYPSVLHMPTTPLANLPEWKPTPEVKALLDERPRNQGWL